MTVTPRRRLSIAVVLAGLLVATAGTGSHAAQGDGRSGSHWAGPLPAGVSFEPLDGGRVAEGRAMAGAVAVTRVSQAPGAVSTRVFRRPAVILLESGTLTFVDRSGGGDSAVVFPAGGRGRPVTAGAGLALARGDLLVVPPAHGGHADHGYMTLVNLRPEPATYLELEAFPGGEPPWATLLVDTAGFAVAPLAVASGAGGGRSATPSAVSIGRLTLAPGASVPLGRTGPAVLLVEGGAVELVAEAGDVPAARPGIDYGATPGVVHAGEGRTLGVGGAAFVRPGATGTFRNPGRAPITALVVGISLATR